MVEINNKKVKLILFHSLMLGLLVALDRNLILQINILRFIGKLLLYVVVCFSLFLNLAH